MPSAARSSEPRTPSVTDAAAAPGDGFPGVTLMVASVGGHLKELHRLAPRISPPPDEVVWVTNDTPQSRSLLAGERVYFLSRQDSRDLRKVLVNARIAAPIVAAQRPARVVSTGAAIAVSVMPLARALGAQCHYIESGTRVHGPSITVRFVGRLPGVRCYTQHRYWQGPRWRYAGSVLDGFHVGRDAEEDRQIRRVAVVLGTWRQGFRSVLERLVAAIPPEVETLWQTGYTDVEGLPIDARGILSLDELGRWLREAVGVVTHAGMGASLDALEAGRCPVVIPRRQAAGEQVDDHQVELAAELDRRGLAVARLPEEVGWEDIMRAASRRVEARPPPPVRLV